MRRETCVPCIVTGQRLSYWADLSGVAWAREWLVKNRKADI